MTYNENLKKLLIAVSTSLTLAACNGGGGGGSSGGSPSPSPSPGPSPSSEVLPLEITQTAVPNIDKVGKRQSWYMIVKNPNPFDIIFSNQEWVNYDPNNQAPINPTQYRLDYDNGNEGVVIDCANLERFDVWNVKMAAGQSCAYKFETLYYPNTTGQTNFSFRMNYAFYNESDYVNNINTVNRYVESSVCNEQKTDTGTGEILCLPNNQNLQFNLLNFNQVWTMTQFPHTAKSDILYNGNVISMDGNVVWEGQLDPVTPTILFGPANQYQVNYNANNNTYNKVLLGSYQPTQYYGNYPLASVPYDGSNYYSMEWNKNGIIPIFSSGGVYNWIYGLDKNMYVQNGSNVSLFNTATNQITPVTTINETVIGASENGSFLSVDDTQRDAYYCYNKNNNYTRQTLNVGNLVIQSDMISANITPDGLRLILVNNSKYKYMMYNQYQSVYFSYKVNMDTCSIDQNNAFPASSPNGQYEFAYNEKFGVANGRDGKYYIFPRSQVSTGYVNN